LSPHLISIEEEAYQCLPSIVHILSSREKMFLWVSIWFPLEKQLINGSYIFTFVVVGETFWFPAHHSLVKQLNFHWFLLWHPSVELKEIMLFQISYAPPHKEFQQLHNKHQCLFWIPIWFQLEKKLINVSYAITMSPMLSINWIKMDNVNTNQQCSCT